MVLISHEKKFIFLKTQKSAGSSLEESLEHYLLGTPLEELGENSSQRATATAYVSGRAWVGARDQFMTPHSTARQVRNKLGEERFGDYLKATTVRNPWDQIVSFFWWRLRKHSTWRDLAAKAPLPVLKIWFSIWYFASNQRLTGLSYHHRLSINGVIPEMHIIRYESLEADLMTVLDKLGIHVDKPHLPRLKSRIRMRSEPFQDYYFAPVRRHLARQRASDLQHFGYEWNEHRS